MTTELMHLPRRRSDVVLREDGDRSVLVDPDHETLYALNPTARAIWELCDGTTTVEEVTDAICQVFAVDPPTANREVAATLRQLSTAGLVEPLEQN